MLGYYRLVEAIAREDLSKSNWNSGLKGLIYTWLAYSYIGLDESRLDRDIGVCYDRLDDQLQSMRWIRRAAEKGDTNSMKNRLCNF